jgi:hypothetical protein
VHLLEHGPHGDHTKGADRQSRGRQHGRPNSTGPHFAFQMGTDATITHSTENYAAI